jgi:AAA15 family ATPase/GTPase
MQITKFHIQNFKSFKDVTLILNKDVNILTGKNNAGKTTVLEAISLWYECFSKLLSQAKRGEKNYKKDQWILGPTSNRYFEFDKINSVKSPNFEDIFHECNKRNKIKLEATIVNQQSDEIKIKINIGESGNKYIIELEKFTTYDFQKFNTFFSQLPFPFNVFYASPIATVNLIEEFATNQHIEQAYLTQKSSLYIRNRLFRLSKFEVSFEVFKNDLAYILGEKVDFQIIFDETKDIRILLKFRIGNQGSFKDIALLGSGTLQLIEILLNFYQADTQRRDLNLIMLDEPDSYIHRDIQKRLIEIVTRFSQNTQIIISTHNESFIRSASVEHLFHLEGKLVGEYKPISEEEIEKLQPRFKGIYPSLVNPIIRSVGEITGLDFINAIECDRLIFVEGEDDARVLNMLLKHRLGPKKKYMFWVLGGISEVFENILAYKTVFSTIKNGQSLWQKSCLVMDKDFLSIHHKNDLIAKFKQKYDLDVFVLDAYTFESSIFENLENLAELISIWIESKTQVSVDKGLILIGLQTEYNKVCELIQKRYTDKFIEEETFRYKNIRDKVENLLGGSIIQQNDVQLTTLVRSNLKDTLINTTNYYWLMKKEDVESVINPVVLKYGLNFECETDFIELIKLVSRATWMSQWGFINRL